MSVVNGDSLEKAIEKHPIYELSVTGVQLHRLTDDGTGAILIHTPQATGQKPSLVTKK